MVWDVEEVATCNDLDLLASNETSTSSHLNVPRPRMTVGFKVGLMETGPGWDEQAESRQKARDPGGGLPGKGEWRPARTSSDAARTLSWAGMCKRLGE